MVVTGVPTAEKPFDAGGDVIGGVILAAAPLAAQNLYERDYSKGAGTFPNFGIFNPPEVPEANLADSPRMQELIRSGKLYLTLADAIALALENNLDIEVARYSPLEADSDIRMPSILVGWTFEPGSRQLVVRTCGGAHRPEGLR